MMKIFNWIKSAPKSYEVVEVENEPIDIAPTSQGGQEIKNQTVLSSDVDAMLDLFNIQTAFGGQSVTPKTSMKLSIVFACVRLIAGALAQMPIHVFKDVDSRERVNDYLSYLLKSEPCAVFSAATFMEYIVACMLLHGDGFAIISRLNSGKVESLIPVSPLDVEVKNVDGRLQYYIRNGNETLGFDQDDILHFAGFGFDGLRSKSVIQWGALHSISLSMAMQEFSGEFFENGAHQSVALIKEGKMSPDQKQSLRESYVKTYGGNKKGKYPLVLDKTVGIKELSINAKDSQLLESRDYQVTDIARAFGLPSFMVNQEQKTSSFGSGVSEIALSFLRFTLSPHVRRFEQELNRKLFKRGSNFCELETSGLMRGTQKERYELYESALGNSQQPGWMTVNEVRKLENKPPFPGDKYNYPIDPFTQGANNAENK